MFIYSNLIFSGPTGEIFSWNLNYSNCCKEKKVTSFNYPWDDWVTVTDGVRALVRLNMLLETHVTVSVIIFSLCLINISFPRFQLKLFFSVQVIWQLETSIDIQSKLLVRTQNLSSICASAFPSNYSLVVSRACTETIWRQKAPMKPLLINLIQEDW